MDWIHLAQDSDGSQANETLGSIKRVGNFLTGFLIKEMGSGICPLCVGKKGVRHIPLSCPETRKWRTELLSQ